MSLKVAVQMDPIQRINIKGDSTFALLLEAQKRGHILSYYTTDRLAMRDGKVFSTVESLKVRDQAGDHFVLEAPRRVDLSEFDVVLLRQDPPFDLNYITSTHLLERIHPKTLVVNDPGHVRNAPEKIFVTHFSDLMPPTLITRDLAEIKAFRAEHNDIVMKPLYGHGGGAVFRITRDDLIFVGIDVIGDWITEINVTSPTGIRAVKNLGGPDAAAMVWDAIEKKRTS